MAIMMRQMSLMHSLPLMELRHNIIVVSIMKNLVATDFL
jgi:hypothetical protein